MKFHLYPAANHSELLSIIVARGAPMSIWLFNFFRQSYVAEPESCYHISTLARIEKM